MKFDSDMQGSAGPNSPWPGVIKVVFLFLLIAIVFLLGRDMVRHRFFRGGSVNQRDVLRP